MCGARGAFRVQCHGLLGGLQRRLVIAPPLVDARQQDVHLGVRAAGRQRQLEFADRLVERLRGDGDREYTEVGVQPGVLRVAVDTVFQEGAGFREGSEEHQIIGQGTLAERGQLPGRGGSGQLDQPLDVLTRAGLVPLVAERRRLRIDGIENARESLRLRPIGAPDSGPAEAFLHVQRRFLPARLRRRDGPHLDFVEQLGPVRVLANPRRRFRRV